jgi:hypothetical protein
MRWCFFLLVAWMSWMQTQAGSNVRLLRWSWSSDRSLDAWFSGVLDSNVLIRTDHWQPLDGDYRVNEVQWENRVATHVTLQFDRPIPARWLMRLRIWGLLDGGGEQLADSVLTVYRYAWSSYDLVIHEIMADPTPVQGLPDAEWLEIRNRSPFSIDLQGCRIGKGQGMSGPMPSRILPPDSVMVVCSSGSLPLMQRVGPAISVTSFPSLINAGDQLMLWSPGGWWLHGVRYSDEWYRNEVKQQGGWTMEMMDVGNPCGGDGNWIASDDPSGGTPGRWNQASRPNADRSPPALLRVSATDSIHVDLIFNESLRGEDSIWIHQLRIDSRNDWIQHSRWKSPFLDVLELTLSRTLQPNEIHTLQISSFKDCAGNTQNTNQKIRFGLSGVIDSGDVVLNEIFFNPPPEGADYLELINRSEKIIRASDLVLARINDQGEPVDVTPLTTSDRTLLPGELMVLTTDAAWVSSRWKICTPNQLLEISTLPGMYDDAGKIRLLTKNGRCIDALDYQDDWHFPLLSKVEGISLERIDVHMSTQLSSNWHSAASSVLFGTPGCKNSQAAPNLSMEDVIQCHPKIISPNNDGFDDLLTIRYQFPEPGMVADVQIFDDRGHWIRDLIKSSLCGRTGSWSWNGRLESGSALSRGAYIVFIRVIGLSGKRVEFKRVCYIEG